jgi:hypothetical protein
MLMRWYKDRPWMTMRPITDTFEYYREIPSYSSRYPRYYGKIIVIDESDRNLRTEEFLNLNLDKHRNHASIEVDYHFDNSNKISFEITGNAIIERIHGELAFASQEFIYNKQRGVGTLVSGTISALAVISQPPGSKDSTEYEQMLVYLGERDAELLEGKPVAGYQVGQQCIRCGKGKLQVSAEKEVTKRDRDFPLKEQEVTVEVFLCDYCGTRFEGTLIRLK